MKRLVLLTVMMVTLLTSFTFAGSKKESLLPPKTKRMQANLLVGINSHNDGLRKSSIYYAGKYKVVEAVETLSEQLEKEKDPGTRILIALSLYSIGSPEGMTVVLNSAKEDADPRVRRMCGEIYENYRMNDVKELYTISDNK